jgi:hypothetical protein
VRWRIAEISGGYDPSSLMSSRGICLSEIAA